MIIIDPENRTMCKSDENALGQVTDRYLDSTAGVIRQKFTYPASENFRLTALQSGVSPTYNNLQNLSYTYDAVGNVKSIVDVANSSQRQCYNYDALHRLLRGFTTGVTTCNNNPNTVGSGPFDETTTYQDVLGGRGGNLTSKTGVGNYTYGAAQAADCPEGALVKANAVVAAGSNYLSYCYDQNGSLRRRKVGSNTTATYGYDAENRLVTVSGAAAAAFVYDGDGNRVKATFGGTTTVYVGNTYERDNGTTVRKYYYAGGVRVAMRSGGQIYYLLGDHLGGTNVTANSSGAQISKLLYKPWGETRYSTGTTPTAWRFTGQREDATIGLYFYNARYLDPQLGRFTQADTIVPEPGNPQALNRYSYVNNRPTVLIDPTGRVAHPNCQGAGAAIADCGVDGWYGYEDYAVRKQLRAMGQREGDKVARALLDVVSALFEPADYIATIGACLSGDCSVLALAAMALPVVPGAIGRNADEAAGFVRSLDKDLYAFGNRTAPRPPRVGKDVTPGIDGVLSLQTPPFPNGASTFADPLDAPPTGHYHRLPAGTKLPSGLDVVADGLDVSPASPHPATHHTIFNAIEMTLERFAELFSNLPWQYGGKK